MATPRLESGTDAVLAAGFHAISRQGPQRPVQIDLRSGTAQHFTRAGGRQEAKFQRPGRHGLPLQLEGL